MTETATSTPLTRREAREIERRTGHRARAGAVAPVSLPLTTAAPLAAPSFVHDTAEIEPNTATSLVSVFPTELLDRAVDLPRTAHAAGAADAEAPLADEASAFARPVSIRAARPAAVVARARRRTAAGIGVAASAAVLATAAIAVPGAVAQQNQQQAAQAALVQGGAVAEGVAQVDAAGQNSAVGAVDLVAAPETSADRGQFAVTSFSASQVEQVVVAPVTTTTNDGTSTDAPSGSGSGESSGSGSTGTSSGASAGDSSGSSGSSSGSSGGGSSAPAPAPATGADTSGILGIAESMLGGGSGWYCTTYTYYVYQAAGINLPQGNVSTQASGGTVTSNPQPGDLVVFGSRHIGIYAGGNMMYDNPGYDSDYVGWQNTLRPITNVGSDYYFVTYR